MEFSSAVGFVGGQATPRPVAGQVLLALRRLGRAVDLHSRSLMQRWGLTGPQLVILDELARRGEMSTGALAEAVSLSQATVTGILDRLERRGLIERRRGDTDKRRVLVRPTDACWRLLETAPPLLAESFVEEFGRLAEWEQTLILTSLQRLVLMMERHTDT